MSSHNTTIKDYNSAKELAIDLSNLRYDVLAEILKELSKKLEMDAEKDLDRGRIKLHHHLINASLKVEDASQEISKAWSICEPYMDDC
jgi:RNA-binding protein YlmH